MSLDLSNLQAGDTIRATRDGPDWSLFKRAQVVYVGKRVLAVIDGEERFITPEAWERIVPPPPCPITKPTTLFVSSSGYIGTKGFATCDPGERALTLHPPGTSVDSHEWGVYTWGAP